MLSYSSLAVVLLIADARRVARDPGTGGARLVLGANLGSGLLVVLSTLRAVAEARRVPMGNLIFKLLGCAARRSPLLPQIASGCCADRPRARSAQVVLFHLGFNIALMMLFIGFVGPVARVTERPLPARAAGQRRRPGGRSYLDPTALADAGAGDRLRGARGAAPRRHRRDDAERHADGAAHQRPASLPSELRKMDDMVDELYTGDQALPHADLAARRSTAGREPALGRHRLVHDQHGAGRRHHRAHPDRHRGQEDPPSAAASPTAGHGGDRATCTRGCSPTCARACSVFLNGDVQVRAAAARGEGAVPRPRARVRRQPLAPPARQHAAEHRDVARCTSTSSAT